jgi:hypothetical protein
LSSARSLLARGIADALSLVSRLDRVSSILCLRKATLI